MVGTLEKLPFFLSDHGDDDAAIAAAVLVFNASLAAAALGHRATTVEGTFTGLGDRPIHRIVTDILVGR